MIVEKVKQMNNDIYIINIENIGYLDTFSRDMCVNTKNWTKSFYGDNLKDLTMSKSDIDWFNNLLKNKKEVTK